MDLSDIAGKSGAELQELLKNLGDADLKSLIDSGRKILRASKAQGKDSISSEELEAKRAELQPFEDQVVKATADYNAFKQQLDDKYKEMRLKRKEALEKAYAEVQRSIDARDAKRNDLGLKPTRASSVGPSQSWHVRVVDLDNKIVEVGLKDQPETFKQTTLNAKSVIPTAWVRENIINANGIQDPNEGRLRGVLAKVKTVWANAVKEATGGADENSEAAPAEENTPSE